MVNSSGLNVEDSPNRAETHLAIDQETVNKMNESGNSGTLGMDRSHSPVAVIDYQNNGDSKFVINGENTHDPKGDS